MRSWLFVGVVVAGCSTPQSSSDSERFATYTTLARAELAPTWSVRYGSEFWSPQPTANPYVAVDRVSHAIRDLRVIDPTYAASYEPRGLAMRPVGSAGSLLIRTSRVAVGDRVLRSSGEWSVLGNTAQRLLDATSGIIEHHAVTGDGVEISWIVRDRVRDDLVVDLATDAARYVGQTASGDHFAVAGAQVRIGRATLVDASGQRWPIPTELVDNHTLRWRVPAATLANATFPIALDPTVSPELGSDTPIPAAAASQREPALATSGTTTLVIWAESEGVRGTRLDASGVPVDPAGILISEAAEGIPFKPRIASNGTDFFAVWNREAEIAGARIAGNGTVLDAPSLVVATDPALASTVPNGIDPRGPDIASNGTDYVAVWATDPGISARHLGSNGSVSTTELTLPADFTKGRPAIASDGTDYLVVWNDERSTANARDIFGARITTTGVSSAITISHAVGFQQDADVAWNGSEYFVVWSDRRADLLEDLPNDNDVYGARVTAAGTVTDTSGIAISTAAGDQHHPQLASIGGNYLVTWTDMRNSYPDIYGARVTSSGVVSDPTGIAIGSDSDNETGSSVVAAGATYLVAWQRQHGATDTIDGSRVTTAGTVSDSPSVRLSTVLSNAQTSPAVASNDTGFLFVWRDFREPQGGIIATRVTSAGTIQDVNGLTITTSLGSSSPPAVASNGSDYLVVWNVTDIPPEIRGSRVTGAGVVDTAPFTIATNYVSPFSNNEGRPHDPVAASVGGNYLVAWSDNRCSSPDPGNGDFPCQSSARPGVYGSIVTSAGVSTSPGGIAIATRSSFDNIAYPTAVAANGSNYLVAWRRDLEGTYASLVTNAAAHAASDVSLEIDGASGTNTHPAVASDGSDFLVVWSNTDGTVGARVSAAGANLDPSGITISSVASGFASSAVASDGNSYLVVSQHGADLEGTRVTTTGAVVDTNAFPISETVADDQRPQLAGAANQPYLVVYQQSYRVTARLISPACGDSNVDPAETCDDGNTTSGDGCSSTCSIEAGFGCSDSPSACIDIDECVVGNAPCSQDAQCVNSIGSYTCSCNAGFSGDGMTCTPIDDPNVTMSEDDGGCNTSHETDTSCLWFLLVVFAGSARRRRRSRRSEATCAARKRFRV